MSKEANEEMEKRMDKNRVIDTGWAFPTYPVQATGNHQKSSKSDADKGEITDSLTATYWG
jgi:hypothetical protein